MSISLLAALPPALLLGCGLLPRTVAERHVELLRRVVAALVALAFGTATLAALQVTTSGPESAFTALGNGFSIGVRIDGLSVVVALLIGFVASVIVRYTDRYLDGEPNRARFFQWVGYTTGSVLLFVLADDLLVMTLAWASTSYGLHHLLLLCPDRPGARLAARHKFLVSRLGDVFLVSGLVVTHACFGTLRYDEIFAAIESGAVGESSGWLVSTSAILFALGAMTKSAQFPLHGWLPDTMETPTPVSALMHAGIINAGGFLVIRLSPLVALEPAALGLLAVVGAVTALFGAVVMLTQPSVKRALAYSTIAQMGFMLLQCGLGAFSAALLHIVAHSLYKAHAFLGSGSVLDTSARTNVGDHTPSSPLSAPASLAISLGLALALTVGSAVLFGQTPEGKPGAVLLGAVLVLALGHLFWSAVRTGRRDVLLASLLWGGFACLVYRAAYAGFDAVLVGFTPVADLHSSPLELPLLATLVPSLCGLMLLQSPATGTRADRLSRALYVHASNGFYTDIPVRRLVARLWGEPAHH